MDPALCEAQVLLYEGDRSGSLVAVTYEWSEDVKQLTVTPLEALNYLNELRDKAKDISN